MGGHSIAGMFFLNLPICIVIAIVYMNVLEDGGVIQLLPDFIAKKWPRFGRNVKSYAIAEWLNFIFLDIGRHVNPYGGVGCVYP